MNFNQPGGEVYIEPFFVEDRLKRRHMRERKGDEEA